MAHKWSDNDEKILLFLALEHGVNNYKAIAEAWPGQGGHTLRGITDRLRNIRSGVKTVGVARYFSDGGRITKSASPRTPKKHQGRAIKAEKKTSSTRKIKAEVKNETELDQEYVYYSPDEIMAETPTKVPNGSSERKRLGRGKGATIKRTDDDEDHVHDQNGHSHGGYDEQIN